MKLAAAPCKHLQLNHHPQLIKGRWSKRLLKMKAQAKILSAPYLLPIRGGFRASKRKQNSAQAQGAAFLFRTGWAGVT